MTVMLPQLKWQLRAAVPQLLEIVATRSRRIVFVLQPTIILKGVVKLDPDCTAYKFSAVEIDGACQPSCRESWTRKHPSFLVLFLLLELSWAYMGKGS
jgi:hypothetical protein